MTAPLTIDQMCAVVDRGMAEIDRLRKWQSDAVALLDEIAEYFDDYADADQPAGCAYPIPNAAMRLGVQCDLLTARARTAARDTLRDQLTASLAVVSSGEEDEQR